MRQLSNFDLKVPPKLKPMVERIKNSIEEHFTTPTTCTDITLYFVVVYKAPRLVLGAFFVRILDQVPRILDNQFLMD